MKNNYATIDIDFLACKIEQFEYLKNRSPKYAILSNETLSLLKRRGKEIGIASVAIDDSLLFGEIVIL